MSLIGNPPGTSLSIATRSRSEPARDVLRTSLDQEGLPPRTDVSPEAFSAGWLVFLIVIGAAVVSVVLFVLRGIPAWP